MSDQYELKDIRCFLSIARAGSISRAATAYNIPKATLSHHLRRLEDALHVELFVRKAKGLELTDAGKEFLDHASIIFDTCENAVSAAQRAHSTISGRIRIVASSAFGTSLIGAAAHYFAIHNPQIDFDLQMYPNDKIIAGQFDFDCMIFVGDPPTSSLLRRKMGDVSFGLYASPQFIEKNGMPSTLEEVNTCDGVVYLRNGLPERWRVRNDKRVVNLNPHARFNVNEYWMAKYFAVEGLVIGYLPDFFVRYEVEQGGLVPILPEWRSDDAPVYAVYPQHRHRNPRIMKLVDSMCSQFDEFVRSPGYRSVRIDYGQG
ncbi:MAG: LysR family transcriptional regulator [Rhizobiaceae bacterium]|nr:LysR family transcriptional regulator [Rhizobiaceae bacterium]